MLAHNENMQRNPILTEALVNAAFLLVTQQIETILEEASNTWKIDHVWVAVKIPCTQTTLGKLFTAPRAEVSELNPVFKKVALRKMELSDRTCMNTKEAVDKFPWLLSTKDYLSRGGVHNNGISVGVAGSVPDVDQLIAEIIIKSIEIATRLRTMILMQSRSTEPVPSSAPVQTERK